MPPDDDNGDTAGTGQLEGGGRRLGAATGDPGVVYNKDVGAGDRIANSHPARVNASNVDLLRRDSQPHQGQGNARPDHAD